MRMMLKLWKRHFFPSCWKWSRIHHQWASIMSFCKMRQHWSNPIHFVPILMSATAESKQRDISQQKEVQRASYMMCHIVKDHANQHIGTIEQALQLRISIFPVYIGTRQFKIVLTHNQYPVKATSAAWAPPQRLPFLIRIVWGLMGQHTLENMAWEYPEIATVLPLLHVPVGVDAEASRKIDC